MSPWWLLVGLAIFLIGVTKSGFGSGVGLMLVPMMAIALGNLPGYGSEAAIGLLLPLLIAGDLIAVYQYRRLFSTSVVKRLMPGTLAGVIVGGVLLWWFHQQRQVVGSLMRVEIGLESIVMVGLHWWRLWRGVQDRLMPEPWRSHLAGSFAAVSSTLAHAAGPVIAMYLLPLRLDRQLFVGTTALYFFILNTAKLPAYWSSGQFAVVSPAFALGFLPLVALGGVVGFWMNRRISDRLFTTVVYAVTFVLGWYILADGVRNLVAYARE